MLTCSFFLVFMGYIYRVFRDAEDAVRGRDGYPFDGYNIRVEFPRSSSRGRGGRMGGYGGGGYGGGRFGGGGGGGGMRGSRPRGYQLMVSGLPPTGSWQDVKVRVHTMHSLPGVALLIFIMPKSRTPRKYILCSECVFY